MDKLQELTDKLYNEGLSKGKAEGEAILAKAKEEAAAIVENARKEAAAVMAQAQAKADELKSKTASDIRMASEQAIQATKGDIEKLVVAKAVDASVKDAMTSADFVKAVLTEVAKKFSADNAADLEVVLPERLKEALEPFVKNELGNIIGKGVEASFSKRISGGFNIAPKDGGYFISLTDETMNSLISEYLRPATKKILFGE